MGGFVDTITGGSARREAAAAAQTTSTAQAVVAAKQDEEATRLRRIEDGMMQNAKRGFGGLLSWVNDSNVLKRTLG